jgi:hypothetical protein
MPPAAIGSSVVHAWKSAKTAWVPQLGVSRDGFTASLGAPGPGDGAGPPGAF